MRGRSLEVHLHVDQASSLFREIFLSFGKIKREQVLEGSGGDYLGRLKYGLQRVPTRVMFTGTDSGTTVVDVISHSSDLGQTAAKKVATRFQSEIEQRGYKCEFIAEEDVSDLFPAV